MKVAMIHSVGNNESEWCQNWLSVSLVHFETLCRYLARRDYRAAHLDEWYHLQDHPGDREEKTIFLTFDDGYLDNWVYAYPVLAKYGLKGTVFINPEFVDPSDLLRPNLEDVWNHQADPGQLQTLGFLNWKEIRKLDSTGILDVQSHSMSHNYYFRSDRIVDLYRGQWDYHWLPWITHPERKHLWLNEDQRDLVERGYPVFEYGRALGVRRYFPDERIIGMGIGLASDGSMQPSGMVRSLQRELENYPGRYETDEEMTARFRYEIEGSKAILEERLSKRVDYLCWPGGGYREESLQIAVEAGYRASTLASGEDAGNFDNSLRYKRIRRFGLSSVLEAHGVYYFQKPKRWLVCLFHSGRGKPLCRYFVMIIHRLHLLWGRVRVKKG
jgi:peptidoglycan/xylan/chitin deacetylase (PgdA/CDA1 family)